MAKIKYGLRNVHYCKITAFDPDTGAPTYDSTVKSWPGAVNLSLEPQGEQTPFYADDITYYMVDSNNGYQGDFESALIPEDFKTSILGFITDDNDVVVEDVDANVEHFALMFQFKDDEKGRRYVFYNCTATRPGVSGATKAENVEPQTETVTITATSVYNATLDKDIVKACATGDSDSTVYENWFDDVYLPEATGGVTT